MDNLYDYRKGLNAALAGIDLNKELSSFATNLQKPIEEAMNSSKQLNSILGNSFDSMKSVNDLMATNLRAIYGAAEVSLTSAFSEKATDIFRSFATSIEDSIPKAVKAIDVINSIAGFSAPFENTTKLELVNVKTALSSILDAGFASQFQNNTQFELANVKAVLESMNSNSFATILGDLSKADTFSQIFGKYLGDLEQIASSAVDFENKLKLSFNSCSPIVKKKRTSRKIRSENASTKHERKSVIDEQHQYIANKNSYKAKDNFSAYSKKIDTSIEESSNGINGSSSESNLISSESIYLNYIFKLSLFVNLVFPNPYADLVLFYLISNILSGSNITGSLILFLNNPLITNYVNPLILNYINNISAKNVNQKHSKTLNKIEQSNEHIKAQLTSLINDNQKNSEKLDKIEQFNEDMKVELSSLINNRQN